MVVHPTFRDHGPRCVRRERTSDYSSRDTSYAVGLDEIIGLVLGPAVWTSKREALFFRL